MRILPPTKIYVSKSDIHGYGIFAKETILEGELIEECPIFDLNISFDEIDQMFEEYGSYFQRYGCLSPDQIISWDNENVLFDDEFGNVEIVKRPDILLNIQ
jgi:hypothetical protein